MKIYIVVLFSLLQVTVSAQVQEEVDKLLQTTDSLLKKEQYLQARQTADLALSKSNQATLYKGTADSYMRIGQVLKRQEEYEEALVNYRKALRIRANILKDNIAVARTYTSMCSVEVELDSTDLALSHARKAESIYLAERSFLADSLRAMLYNNMAIIFKALDSLDQAVAIGKKGLALFPITKDTLNKIKTEYSLAQNLIEQEKYDEAKLHLDTAILLGQKMHQPDSLLLGRVYEARGVIEMSNGPSDSDQAIKYFEQARDIFLRFPEAKANLTNVYFNLGEVYDYKGELDQANSSYRSAKNVGSNLSDQLDFPQLIETRIENTDVNMRKQKLEMWLTIALASLLVTLIIIALKESSNARTNKLLYLREKENAKATEIVYIKEKENADLREQMYLLRHDIVKNFLQVVKNQIADNTPEKTGKTFEDINYMINKLFAQIGYGDAVGKVSATLRDFVTEMHLWVGIVARMPVVNETFWTDLPNLPLSSTIREELEAIITEAFTNIRKYAFDATTEPKIASLRFEYLFDQGLVITIEDQGKGFQTANVDQSGLHNMQVRADRINSKLDIQSVEGKGTSIKLSLPNFSEI